MMVCMLTAISLMLTCGVSRRLVLSVFFQAEDGIRDLTVTGVQTCALPISSGSIETRWIGVVSWMWSSGHDGGGADQCGLHLAVAIAAELRARNLESTRRRDRKSVV